MEDADRLAQTLEGVELATQDRVSRGQEPSEKVEAIVATGLIKHFDEGEARMTAVNNVTFTAHFGEMVFLVDPSGSGKTTFLSMISGILRPDAGVVRVKGSDIWGRSNDQLADFRLNAIGFVFQDYHLFPNLTTAEIPPVQLAGGEQQRVAIAKAMVGSPEFLIFDEPTASLDGDTGKMIIAFVKKIF